MSSAARVAPSAVRGGLLLAAFLLVLWGVWPRSQVRTPSSEPPDETAADGFAALLQVAERLDLHLEAWTRPLGGLPDDGTLLLLAPDGGLGETELDALLTWVRAGGHLIYVPPLDLDDDPLLEALELRRDTRSVARRGSRFGTVSGTSTVLSDRGRRLLEGLPQQLAVGTHWLRGKPTVAEVLVHDGEARERAAHVLFNGLGSATPDTILAARRFPARGRVHVLSDPTTLRNDGLHGDGLGLALLRALALSPEPRLLDRRTRELGGGFTNPASDLARASRSAFGRLVLLLLLALGLIAWRRAAPLGAPRPERVREGRSSLEHVRSLAGAWELSGDEVGAARRVAEALSLRAGSSSVGALRARMRVWRRRHPELTDDLDVITRALDGHGRSLDAVSRAARRVQEHAVDPAVRTATHGVRP